MPIRIGLELVLIKIALNFASFGLVPHEHWAIPIAAIPIAFDLNDYALPTIWQDDTTTSPTNLLVTRFVDLVVGAGSGKYG